MTSRPKHLDARVGGVFPPQANAGSNLMQWGFMRALVLAHVDARYSLVCMAMLDRSTFIRRPSLVQLCRLMMRNARAITPCLVVLAASMIGGCQRFDPLWVEDNGAGAELLDVLIGQNARVVCIDRAGPRSNDDCSSATAQVYVRDLPDIDRHLQMMVKWREGDASTVDVFVFGGRVIRCEPQTKEGIRIVLKQLPTNSAPPSQAWDDITTGLFVTVKDVCGSGEQP